MPRSRPPYSPEYRQQMVDLVRGGADARFAIAGAGFLGRAGGHGVADSRFGRGTKPLCRRP